MPTLRSMITSDVITQHVVENEDSVKDKKKPTLVTRMDEPDNVALVGFDLLKWVNSKSTIVEVFVTSSKSKQKAKKK
ncbi:hypothetical protein CEK28_10400 [Xenophilus sp. AP218F]|nr:hypothetical protein CEK28_10400 [Xenophilus sp. AP218F]